MYAAVFDLAKCFFDFFKKSFYRRWKPCVYRVLDEDIFWKRLIIFQKPMISSWNFSKKMAFRRQLHFLACQPRSAKPEPRLTALYTPIFFLRLTKTKRCWKVGEGEEKRIYTAIAHAANTSTTLYPAKDWNLKRLKHYRQNLIGIGSNPKPLIRSSPHYPKDLLVWF